MHSGAVYPFLWLGHKGGVKAVALGDGLGRHFKGHNVIRRLKHIRILKIDLMLAWGDLVMGGFHLKFHGFQIQHNIPAHIFRQVDGGHVKISRRLMGIGGRPPIVVRMEQEKLALRPHLEGIAHLLCLLCRLAQHIPGISLKRLLVYAVDVADQPGHLALLRTPWKDLKGVQIRIKIHIRFFDTHKALDGGAVKNTPVFQRLRQLSHCNRHIFQHAENIRKLQADELYIFLLCHPDNILPAVLAHTLHLFH